MSFCFFFFGVKVEDIGGGLWDKFAEGAQKTLNFEVKRCWAVVVCALF
jgi:hypothetical protein